MSTVESQKKSENIPVRYTPYTSTGGSQTSTALGHRILDLQNTEIHKGNTLLLHVDLLRTTV